MGQRQFADREGHRWDAKDGDGGIRFSRDDGQDAFRATERGVDELADGELRALLEGREPDAGDKGPDTEANETRGYGEVL